MIITSIRDYIKKCPYLQEFNDVVMVNVDYLEENSTTYSIEEVPSIPILKKYVDGSTLRQFQFIFASREPYGSDILQQIENSNFYEDFSNWIELNNENGILPILEDARLESISVDITSSGYAFAVTENTAQYQIALNFRYLKRSVE